MGEHTGALLDGSEEELMKLITSANIACGYHAGDTSTMEATVRLAVKYNVGIGAHPGYPDRTNFGRISMILSPAEVTRLVYEQIQSLGRIAQTQHCEIVHVKPHGALYDDAARDPVMAEAIASGAAQWSKDLILVGLAGSIMLKVWRESGFHIAPEAFADRVYEPEGTLRSRKFNDAVITDPTIAAHQVLNIVKWGTVLTSAGTELNIKATTVCVHSGTPGTILIAKAVRQTLEEAGINMRGLK